MTLIARVPPAIFRAAGEPEPEQPEVVALDSRWPLATDFAPHALRSLGQETEPRPWLPPQGLRGNLHDLFLRLVGGNVEALPEASPVSGELVASLRAGPAGQSRVASAARAAFTELSVLFDGVADRDFQDAALTELAGKLGQDALVEASKPVRPELSFAVEHQRRGAALEALALLHLHGQMSLSPDFLQKTVRELGRFGPSEAEDTLGKLAQMEGVSSELGAACMLAIEAIRFTRNLPVAHVQLEGGPIKAGGIRSYVNALAKKLAQFGHSQDVYLPLPGHLEVEKEGLKPVPGSAGTIRDPRGREVRFELYALEGEGGPNGAKVTFYFMKDDTYFTPRWGVYEDTSGDLPARFSDFDERLVAGASLAGAAMSKVAAIRKLGGGELSSEQVSAAEQTLEPGDLPKVIQYNDSHLATLHPFLQFNEVFRAVPAAFIMHNGEPGCQQWVPRWMLEGALNRLGGRFKEVLDKSGDAINLMHLALATMFVNVVSSGYLERLVHGNPWLQQAIVEGRGHGILNGIDLESLDPSRIEGTSQAFAYSPEDLRGKVDCKLALQQELKLNVDATAPLLVLGARLGSQKGLWQLVAPSGQALLELTGRDGEAKRLWEVTQNKEVDAETRMDAWRQLAIRGKGRGTVLDALLEAYPKAQLVIGGELAEPALKPLLVELQARHPDNVRVSLGFLDNRRCMSGADLFLYPSLQEPCGLAQMEAMALGTPVLHSDRDGLRVTVDEWDPVLGTGQGPRVDPEDLESLLRGLKEGARWASQSLEAKAPIIRNCMERARRQFDSNDWAANMLAFYREVVNASLEAQAQLH
jgi:glycogen synthase